MRVECLLVLPGREDGEVVGTGRVLLEYVVAHIALVLPAFFGQTFEQNLSFIFGLGRDVDMRQHEYDVRSGHRRPRINRQTVMYTLIVGAIVNGLEPGSEASRILRLFMSLEGRLILPNFHDHGAVRPAGLLDDVYARISAALCAAGFAVLIH